MRQRHTRELLILIEAATEPGAWIPREALEEIRKETREFAPIIAAAPDMLQALQELSAWLVCPDCAPETVEHIKARVDAVIGEAVHDQTN